MTLRKLGEGFIIQKKDGSGWVKFYEDKNNFIIPDLEVKKNMRRHKIGSLLVKKVIELAEAKGKNVQLSAFVTFPDMSEKILIDFYKKLGFVKNNSGIKGIGFIKITI